jgi:hypothetical protein
MVVVMIHIADVAFYGLVQVGSFVLGQAFPNRSELHDE